MPLTTLLVDAGMAASGKQVKDALQRKAVLINDQQCSMDQNMAAASLFSGDAARFGRYFLVKLGKRKHHLFHF